MLRRSKLGRRIANAIALLALSPMTFGSMAGAAQYGGRIPVHPEKADQGETNSVRLKYAQCVLRYQRSLASAFVLDRTQLDPDKKYRPLLDSDCLTDATGNYVDEVALQTFGDTLRFALAEVLLRDEINSIDPARLPRAPRLQTPTLHPADYEPKAGMSYTATEMKAFDEHRQRDQMAIINYHFGDCVVRTDPKGSHDLLVTTEGSGAEGAAFQALMPALQQCLERGAQLKFDPAILRGAIAFGYYSLAHAPAETANR